MFRTTFFSREKKNGAFVGSIYVPKTSNSVTKKAVKFFDAIVNGVPVEVKESFSVFDQEAFDKLIEFENTNDFSFNKCLFVGITWGGEIKGWSFNACKFVDCDFSDIVADDVTLSFCEISNCHFNCGRINAKRVDMITVKDSDFDHCLYSGPVYGTKCTTCNFEEMSFVNTAISRNFFKTCSFKNAILNNTYIRDCSFKDTITEGILYLLPGLNKKELDEYKKSCILAMVGGDNCAQ